MAVALNKFRDTVLRRHRWDSTRGATIKTYFIGQCLIHFSNIYRSWIAELHVARRQEPTDLAEHEAVRDPHDRHNPEKGLYDVERGLRPRIVNGG